MGLLPEHSANDLVSLISKVFPSVNFMIEKSQAYAYESIANPERTPELADIFFETCGTTLKFSKSTTKN